MMLLLVTVISIALAALMGIVAWRIAGEERRRSEARIAALAVEIHAADSLPLRVAASDPIREPRAAAMSGSDLFAGTSDVRTGARWPAVVAAGAFVVATAGALVVVLSSGSHATTHASNQQVAAAKPPVAPVPLELVALGHERDGDRLIVRGVVRNPSSGAPVDRLTAVVFLFNREGGFLTSGRVMIDPSALSPGGESIFVVTVPGAADVGRYRVSFRTDDRIVPHVDRRVPVQAKL
jgi:flagellar basal body-associated protein FliL